MKKLTGSLLLFLFLFCFVTSFTAAQQWTAEQKEVSAGVENYWKINESNPMAFVEYYDDSSPGQFLQFQCHYYIRDHHHLIKSINME